MSDDHDADQAINLPAAIVSAAAPVAERWRDKALSLVAKLVQGSAAIKFSTRVRDNLDTLEGRSIVSRALAEEVAARARADPAIVGRAMNRFLSDELESQARLESIAVLALEDLSQEPQASAEKQDGATAEEVSDDWLRRYAAFAKDVSEADLQRVWARILAGEIKRPGSFSVRTMRFIAEMDKEVAATFQELARLQFSGNALYAPHGQWTEGPNYIKMKVLQDHGLISEIPGVSHRPVKSNESGAAFVWGSNIGLVLKCEPGVSFNVPVVLLTQVGKEALRLLPPTDEVKVLTDIAHANRGLAATAHIGPRIEQGDLVLVPRTIVLW